MSSISLELLHVTWNRDIARKERLGMDYKGCSRKKKRQSSIIVADSNCLSLYIPSGLCVIVIYCVKYR